MVRELHLARRAWRSRYNRLTCTHSSQLETAVVCARPLEPNADRVCWRSVARDGEGRESLPLAGAVPHVFVRRDGRVTDTALRRCRRAAQTNDDDNQQCDTCRGRVSHTPGGRSFYNYGFW